jgi:Nucleotidyl transferase AbiEii toxin, Type IV TA system
VRMLRMSHFSPHLEILPAPQRALWNELSEVSREFVLYGGTALALHLAHRNSMDFDLFGSRALELSQIEQRISFLKGANVIQRDKNTLSAIVDRGGPVKVSFFGVPNPPRLSAPVVAKDNGLGVASLLDLAGTKASVVQVRAEPKITSTLMHSLRRAKWICLLLCLLHNGFMARPLIHKSLLKLSLFSTTEICHCFLRT